MKAELAYRRGELLLKTGEIFQAEQSFLEACRLNGEPPEHRALLAYTKFLNPSADRAAMSKIAVEVLDEVISAKPDFGRAHYFLGEIWKFLKDMDRAAAAYQAAVEADPSLADAQRELAALGVRMSGGAAAAARKTAPKPAPAPESAAALSGKTRQAIAAELMEQAEKAVVEDSPGRPGRRRGGRRVAFVISLLVVAGAAVAIHLSNQPVPRDPTFPQVTPPILMKSSAPPQPEP